MRWETGRRVKGCHCFFRELNSLLRKSMGWLLAGIGVSGKVPEPPQGK